MPARRKARSLVGKPAGSMNVRLDAEAGSETKDRARILGNIGLIKRDAQRPTSNATEVAAELGLDHGYLSRILRGFIERDLIVKTASPDDRRQSLLSLTAKGRMAFAPLEEHSQNEVAAMLGVLSVADQERVVAAMHTIESSLCEAPTPQIPYMLRPPRPGDMGWIVCRHGALYREEYGWDERLEALIAEIVAGFVRNQ